MSSSVRPSASQGRRLGSTLAAFVLGIPMGLGILGLFHYGPLRNTYVFRYVEFPVQWVEVLFFTCGVALLLMKWWSVWREHVACEVDILPRWDGKPVLPEKANDLMASVERLPARTQQACIGRRIRAVLDFVRRRRSAQDLDDQLRALADADAMSQESSFGLVRFITWAIPILGFLGTVIGITSAIAGVTPEVLEESLSTVTDGLAEAFDSTALALGLTMVLMFLSHLIEKQEQSLLEKVDYLVDDQLGHRFQRDSVDAGPFLEIVRENNKSLGASVEALVSKQAEIWASALGEPERRAAMIYQQVQGQLTTALGQALDKTIEAYNQRLGALEQQSVAQIAQLMQHFGNIAAMVQQTAIDQNQMLKQVADGIGEQAQALGKIQEDAANLVHLQAVLHQNLSALASASSFEDAVHSLTAAVHMLTTKVGGGTMPRISQGKAA